MDDAARVEHLRQIGMVARRDRRFEQREQRIAVREAHAIVAREADAARHLDRCDRCAKAKRFDKVRPLARGDDDDHDPLAICRQEIAPEEPVDDVAQPRPVPAGVKHFGDVAEIGRRADRYVGQGQSGLAALPGTRAVQHQRHQHERRVRAREQIPRGQDMVHGFRPRPGHHRIAKPRC